MKFEGKSVFEGIAIGRLSLYKKGDYTARRTKISDTSMEIARFERAKEVAKQQLAELYNKALKEVGEANAAIFEVYQMMLDDQNYVKSITNLIRRQKVNAEYAVAETGNDFSVMFTSMDDECMKARVVDVKDITNRVIAILQKADREGFNSSEPVILITDDLTPSEVVQLDKSLLLSFVTRYGSDNSHTAILAGAMNIPALIGVDFSEDIDGHMGIVDGYEGILYVDPDEDTLAEYRRRQEKYKEEASLLQELKGKENVTKDGTKVKLYANIGRIDDVASALQYDAEGIGLFRSEFLYLESDTFPTEEEQFKIYRSVVEAMGGKKVLIRTLDIGSDKQADYFNLAHEENPAMGYRGIRICLEQPDIFKIQLRALLRASYFGNLSIMYPMIISVNEVKRIKTIVEEVKAELDDQGIPYGEAEQGIMIETPAAVWMTEELAKEVDFFSIGTNDLTQYILAIDRQNPRLDSFYDAHHPAVLRAIQMTVENGHKGGAWVGICGELGADVSLTEEFLRMGVDELSVSPSHILAVRAAIRECDLRE